MVYKLDFSFQVLVFDFTFIGFMVCLEATGDQGFFGLLFCLWAESGIRIGVGQRC